MDLSCQSKALGRLKSEENLISRLKTCSQLYPNDIAIRLYLSSTNIQEITYAGLYSRAEVVADQLINQNKLPPGGKVAVFLETTLDSISAIYGIWLAGGVVVSLPVPGRKNDRDTYLSNLGRVLGQVEPFLIFVTQATEKILSLSGFEVTHIRQDNIRLKKEIPSINTPISNYSTALIQYTSGSTSNPKGVKLTHHAITANIQAMTERLNVNFDSKMLGWCPLFHDMGLIGTLLGPVYTKCETTLIPTFNFIMNPKIWIQMLSDYQITITTGPNFGYLLCANRFPEELIDTIDLSALTHCLVGGEPVKSETLAAFAGKFKKAGFRAESLHPAYGLAENVLAVSLFTEDRPFIESAHPSENSKEKHNRFVSVGTPIPGVEVMILDDTSKSLPEHCLGEVAIKGDSLMTGYVGVSHEETFTRDGWYRTGDLGWIQNGHLYIAGRKTDLMIRGGINYYSHDIEEALDNLEGIRPGSIACFSVPDEELGTERIIIWADARRNSAELQQVVSDEILHRFGFTPDEVELLPPGSVFKTSSGKIQRVRCREYYLRGIRPQPRRNRIK